MMWEINYEAPKGSRVNRYFWGVTVFGPLWYDVNSRKWTESPDGGTGYSTHDHSVKTTKAFIRYLKKHPELKGTDVYLVNNYEGANKECLDLKANWKEI